jgi:hypothetical protein
MMERKGCTLNLEIATIMSTTAMTNAIIRGIPVMFTYLLSILVGIGNFL